MTYTFKLSRRLAIAHITSMLAPLMFLAACTASDLTDSSPTTPDTEPVLADIVVAPQRVVLEPNQPLNVRALLSNASTEASWTASGGTLSADGTFSATEAGTYEIVSDRRGKGKGRAKRDTTVVIVTPTDSTLERVVVAPDPATLDVQQIHVFSAKGILSDGAVVETAVTWEATGGSITASGLYTAGSATGDFRVVARSVSASLADTAIVTIQEEPASEPPPPAPPTVTGVALTPTGVSLAAGQTQQYAANATMSDGTTGPVAVSYQATGGTITSAGLYTAGGTGGSFRVIATQSGGTLADTAAVSITIPPPPPPSIGCGSIAIAPGQSIQAAVNAASTGASFCLKAGTHVRQSVLPKTGQTFVCEAGAVLDGENVATMAFYSQNGNPDNVTIRGCKITRYNPGYQGGVIMAGGASASVATDGWLLEDVEVSYSNTGTGVVIGNRLVCRRCNLHHNDVQNISGIGKRVLVEDSELAYGNYRKLNAWGASGGGSKFVLTDSLVVRRTYVHHNHGPGLWTDIDNIRTTYEANRVEDNDGPGIYHEISWSALIKDNVVKRNGFGFVGWVWGAGIQISASGGTNGEQVEIVGNTLEGNRMDIMAAQQNRGSGAYGPHLVQNMWVHDNTITSLNGAQSGAASDDGSNLATRNLRWDRNTYRANHSRPFGWASSARTWTEWRNFGQDAGGALTQ